MANVLPYTANAFHIGGFFTLDEPISLDFIQLHQQRCCWLWKAADLGKEGKNTVGILNALFSGPDREEHDDDGSYTDRYSDGTTTTRNSDGTIREDTSHETTLPLGFGPKITVTRNGDGEVTNVQEGWGQD